MECFNFRNLKTVEEEYVLEKFHTKMEQYNKFYKCYFEKKEEGLFKVSVYVNNQWNPLYASLENLNLDFLCESTENILSQQLEQLKSTITTGKDRGLDGFL